MYMEKLQRSGKLVHSVNKSKLVRGINNTYINGNGNNHNPIFFVLDEQDNTQRNTSKLTDTHKHVYNEYSTSI